MRPFIHTRPTSATEAVQAFAAAGAGARHVGGGTNLYNLMKLDVERPGHLIDVTAINGLRAIDTGGDVLRFRALAPMSAVAADPVVRGEYRVATESLTRAASQQLATRRPWAATCSSGRAACISATGRATLPASACIRATSASRGRAAPRSAGSTGVRRCWGRAVPAPPSCRHVRRARGQACRLQDRARRAHGGRRADDRRGKDCLMPAPPFPDRERIDARDKALGHTRSAADVPPPGLFYAMTVPPIR